MPILNYTTAIDPVKTAAQIQSMLVKAKAESVMVEYNGFGIPSAISFRIKTEFGIMTFRLPADVDRVYKVIILDGKVPLSMRNKTQASRIAWRIVKDWLAVQIAMIESGLADTVQVFFPYAQNEHGVTLYESMKQNRFSTLLPQRCSLEAQ